MPEQIKNYFKLNWLTIALFLFLILEIVFSIFYQGIYHDEANYQYNGWAIYQYGWIPYHDVWTRITPVSFYVFGLAQYLFGPSFYVGRIVSAVCLLAFAAIWYLIAKKIAGKAAGEWSLAFLIFTPYLVHHYATGTPYSLAMLMIFASFGSTLYFKKEIWQIVFSLFFACLTVLIRQNLAPFLIVIFGYWLLSATERKNKIWVWLTPLLTMTAGLLPFVIIDAKNFFVDMLFAVSGGAENTAKSLISDLYYTVRKNIDFFREFTNIFYLYLIILFMFLVKSGRKFMQMIMNNREYRFISLLIFGFMILYTFHYLLPDFRKLLNYSLYFIPLAILTVIIVLFKFAQSPDKTHKKIINIVLAVCLLVGVATINYQGLYEEFPNSLNLASTDLSRISKAGKIISQHFNKNDTLFILDETNLVLMAGLYVPPALTVCSEKYVNRPLVPDENERYWSKESLIKWMQSVDGVILNSGKWEAYFDNYDNHAEIIKIIKDGLVARCRLVERISNAFPEEYINNFKGACVNNCNQEMIADVYSCGNSFKNAD